ncbi:MAG: prephenate dehydrogenase/arogenate dehydrogenase family protein [Actinomycetota bacterium]
MQRRASVVGLGLIGGSIARALRRAGWTVTGVDLDPDIERAAVDAHVIDGSGLDVDAELVVVATPVAAVPEQVERVLAQTGAVVTDVGSVKSPIAAAVTHPRFVPGHPMAGSEQDGLHGADEDLFSGAVWVLTPTESTSDNALGAVSKFVADLDAEPVVLDAEVHDAIVAVVSHVPHLTAATLMDLATDRSIEHSVLLRLAAGGFRDMTRVAAGRSSIWPDICADNRQAIVGVLDELLVRLGEMRRMVDEQDRDALVDRLESARQARVNLPAGAREVADLVELRIPIPDRPGELAHITKLATDLSVNIHDIELAHSTEGDLGVLILVVTAGPGERLVAALTEQGYHPSLRSLLR